MCVRARSAELLEPSLRGASSPLGPWRDEPGAVADGSADAPSARAPALAVQPPPPPPVAMAGENEQ